MTSSLAKQDLVPLRFSGVSGPNGSRHLGRSRLFVLAVILALAGSLLPHSSVSAQCLTSEVDAVGIGSSAMYGFAVARSGPFLAVGAPGFPVFGPGAGGVFIFSQVAADWVQTSILFPSGLAAGDKAGSSLAMQGNTLVVGLRRDDGVGMVDSGSVHVFEFTGLGWVDVATLTDPDAGEFDEFGASVAIDGDVIIVGSPYDLMGGNETGSASIFRKVGGVWQHESKLLASAGDHGDAFGTAVAIVGNRVIVGAPEANTLAGLDAGLVVIFENTGSSWNEVVTLVSATGSAGDLLGTSVAMTNNTIIAGAPFASTSAFESGSVVPFRRDGQVWLEVSPIASPNPGANRYFGASVDMDSGEVVIGEPFAPVGGQFAAGAAHRYDDLGTTFAFLDTVSDPTPHSGSLVGSSVALEDGELIVGATLDNTNGFASGTALRFVLGGNDCDSNGIPDLCDIAAGGLVDCDGNGVPDACDIAAGNAEDCDLNGQIDTCDIATGADDCDENGMLDACELALNDCNSNGMLDACESDCNANGNPDDCDITQGIVPDCNGNGNPDDCDVFFGISSDCNGNLIPDECDLVSGVSEDCNMNGFSDTCDILMGLSDDADADGIPDECGVRFVRGDLNGDLLIDIADIVLILEFVSTSGTKPPCQLAADINGDGALDIADGVYAVAFLTGGAPPPPPFPECGFEPDPPSGLECLTPPVCP